MANGNLRVIRRENMIVIAISGKTSVNFADLTSCQLIRVYVSPAIIDQISAILCPVGRFNLDRLHGDVALRAGRKQRLEVLSVVRASSKRRGSYNGSVIISDDTEQFD